MHRDKSESDILTKINCMKIAEKHKHESERLKVLESYSILDTLPEMDYDNLTAIASEICNTPISLVSLIDSKRQWFKSHHGLNVSETPIDYAFCAHAIIDPNDIFIIQDTRKDEHFFDNPLVTGEPHIVFYAGVPLVGADDLPIGTLCVIDRKPKLLSQTQILALKALANQVMNLLELRKTKAQLERALQDVEKINLELESFAYIAAHDLKSPLNNISSITDLFLDSYGENLQEDGLKLIELISFSSEKLRKLIEGLLEYSKSNTILKEDKVEVNLKELVKDIKGLFDFENNCEITLKSSLNTIFTNRIAIEQIFINLVSNSIKYNYNPRTEIEIEIKEDDSKYIISIKDNGAGISKENQDKVFQIFKVVAHEDKFGQRGNGIGLATVKKVIEALGGTIYIESELGAGAKFIFTLGK
jgi:signal transduction histidine kinase